MITTWRQVIPEYLAVLAMISLTWLVACAVPGPTPAPTLPALAEELVFYNWVDYMPQSVLAAFTAEYGVKVTQLAYESTEEAVANIKSGAITYDVAVIENDSIPYLVAEGLLAEVDYRNVPNFKNISLNFRDLRFDPGNTYSLPYNYGTTGLIVRSDLTDEPVTHWADLWDERYAGRIAVRAQPVELISVALKSLGYPLNTEDPAKLERALKHLVALKPAVQLVEVEAEQAISPLLTGDAVILVGWPEDALLAQDQNPAITYVLPREGTMLWGDAFVISVRSSHKYTAELFLNFLLRPEISAQIVEAYYYATANEAAYALIAPELRRNPIIFPSRADITRGEWYLPLSPAGLKLYDQVWEHFMSAPPEARP